MALLSSCIWTALEPGPREPLGSYKSVPGPLLQRTPAMARSDTPSGQEQTPKPRAELGDNIQQLGKTGPGWEGTSGHRQLDCGCSFCPWTYCDLPMGGRSLAEDLALGDAAKRWSSTGSLSVFFSRLPGQHQQRVQIRGFPETGQGARAGRRRRAWGPGGPEEAGQPALQLRPSSLYSFLWGSSVFTPFPFLLLLLRPHPQALPHATLEPASSRVRESRCTDQAQRKGVTRTVSLYQFSTNWILFLQGRLCFPPFQLAEVFFSPRALSACTRFSLVWFQEWQSPFLTALQVAVWLGLRSPWNLSSESNG